MGLIGESFERLGGKLTHAVLTAGYDLVLLGRTARWLPSVFAKRQDILLQCHIAGVESMAVTLIVAMFSGMIISLSAGIELARFGQQDVVGALVSITMAREMAPFMTALILAANVGSAMAAEIGTMSVSEEIEALEVMSIDPVRFLVLPRVLAMTIMTPILAVLANLIGNVGGAIVAYSQLGVTFSAYYQQAIDILDLKDVYTGLFKALVFGCVNGIVACGQGLRASGGAIGVGQATRTSVINSFLMIIILGYFITYLFYGGTLATGGGD